MGKKKPIEFFYTNARFNGQTALLAGPFYSIGEAEFCIDILQPIFEAEDKTGAAKMASYGVMRTKKHAGLGIYNKALKANGIEVEVSLN